MLTRTWSPMARVWLIQPFSTKSFTLCPVLTVLADDLDYVRHDAHLDLVISKVLDKLQGKEVVVFESEEAGK